MPPGFDEWQPLPSVATKGAPLLSLCNSLSHARKGDGDAVLHDSNVVRSVRPGEGLARHHNDHELSAETVKRLIASAQESPTIAYKLLATEQPTTGGQSLPNCA